MARGIQSRSRSSSTNRPMTRSDRRTWASTRSPGSGTHPEPTAQARIGAGNVTRPVAFPAQDVSRGRGVPRQSRVTAIAGPVDEEVTGMDFITEDGYQIKPGLQAQYQAWVVANQEA